MKLAGKSPPDSTSLSRLAEAGFDHFELYLSTDILDARDDIVDTCRAADIDTVSVHTPHIDVDEDTTEYYRQTDRIAAELDATLVADSNPVSTRYMPDVYPSEEVQAPSHGYENDPGMSAYYLRKTHLEEKDEPFVLDTAHLHMSEADYLAFVEDVVAEYGVDRLPAVHLDTASDTHDGRRALTDGGVDVEEVVRILDCHEYAGTVVLEVPAAHQPAALELVKSVLDR